MRLTSPFCAGAWAPFSFYSRPGVLRLCMASLAARQRKCNLYMIYVVNQCQIWNMIDQWLGVECLSVK